MNHILFYKLIYNKISLTDISIRLNNYPLEFSLIKYINKEN